MATHEYPWLRARRTFSASARARSAWSARSRRSSASGSPPATAPIAVRGRSLMLSTLVDGDRPRQLTLTGSIVRRPRRLGRGRRERSVRHGGEGFRIDRGDRAGVLERPDAFDALLTAEAGLLHPAERRTQ